MRNVSLKISRRVALAAGVGAVGAVATADEPGGRGPGFPIQGIDVSRWQGKVDFRQVAEAGDGEALGCPLWLQWPARRQRPNHAHRL